MTGNFTDQQVAALQAIRALWPDVRLVLVGASALAAHKRMHWRRTGDLDLTVSMSMAEFPAGLESLQGWTRHAKKEHEFTSPLGIKIDVIPAGAEHLAKGYIEWPSGFRMSLVGLRLAFQGGMPLADVPGLDIAPLAVIALLKMGAWQDRPADRQRDLEDLGHLLDEYVEPGEDEFYSPIVEELQVEYELISSFLLGLHIGRLVNEEELAIAERFLERLDDAGAPHSLMSRLRGWGDDAEQLTTRLKSLGRGLRVGVERARG